MEDFNFPIRYGIIKNSEKIKCGEETYNVDIYIACKCYVLSETRIYLKDGTSKEKYEVFFLYAKEENRIMFEKQYIEFEKDNEYEHKDNLDIIFNSYTDASKYADGLNMKTFRDFVSVVPFDSEYGTKVKAAKANYDKLLADYKTEEERIEEKSKRLSNNVKTFTI